MPTIQVNGVNLYYESYGQGIPLVFIAGFSSDHLFWANILDKYTSQYNVIVLDNRGVGQSDVPDYPYSIELMADDVAALLKLLDVGSAHLVGCSMGGCIVQALAKKYPHLIRSATLVTSLMKIDIRFSLYSQARLKMMQQNVSPVLLIESGLGWIYSKQFLDQPGMIEALIELRLANKYPVTEVGYRNQLAAILAFNSSSWIHEIASPCLVMAAKQDIVCPERDAQELAKRIPEALYYCFEETGHVPSIEAPEEFNKVLQPFLEKNS